jgi:tetratricopeptide (TPR) repeat protein
MNRNVAEEPKAEQISPQFLKGVLLFLLSMAFGIVNIDGMAHSQSGPPPDPVLNSAATRMSSFELALKSNPSDSAARKGEVAAAIAFSLAEKKEHREEAALWLLLRGRYWVPDDPELLLDLGIQEDKLSLLVDADTALAEAVRIRPDDPNTLYTVARVKMDLGQMQSAEQAWLSYIKRDPGNPAAYYGYGVVLQTLGRDDEARSQFEKVDPTESQPGRVALSHWGDSAARGKRGRCQKRIWSGIGTGFPTRRSAHWTCHPRLRT